MSKKEYIIMVLSNLESDRPLAKDLKRFVLLDKFDNQAISGLTDILKQTIATVLKDSTRAKMEKSIELLEKIKEMEKSGQLRDQQDLAALEANFNNLP